MNNPSLRLYRRLLKTMMKSFDGDVEMFHRVRIEARKTIMQNGEETDPVKIQNHIFFGEEARDFLESSLIQGNL
jgi:complex III assembly factor LYRM7